MKDVLANLEQTRGIVFSAKFLKTIHHDISSTKIRMAIRRGKEPVGLTHNVLDYIRENKLYAPSSE